VQVVVPNAAAVAVFLPLPDMMYHLREISTMLCEIADGSSRHPDKLEKRFSRFKLIWDEGNQQRQADILHALDNMAGVVNIQQQQPPHVPAVTAAITQYGGNQAQAILGDGDPAYALARNLMDRIATGAAGQVGNFTPNGHVSGATLDRFAHARTQLSLWLNQSLAQLPTAVASGVNAAAYSDDLVLMRFLEQDEYLSPQQIGFSGVLRAAVIRVETQLQVDLLCNLFRSLLDPRFARPGALLSTSVRFRTYSVPRPTGITYEMTMVVFDNGKATTYLTATTATAGEAPFRRDAVDPARNYASLPEIAAQRKVAAALIEDYLIRQVISRQYEALKTSLPVV